MEYQVALDPNLGISPEEFVAAWNESPQRPAGAEARLGRAGGVQFDPVLMTIIIGVVTEITTGMLREHIQGIVAERRAKGGEHGGEAGGPRITAIEVAQPDGSRVLVVTAEER